MLRRVFFSFALLLCINIAAVAQSSVKLKVNEEHTTENGLKVTLLKNGKGKILAKGDKVKVHYKGELVDGRPFDSSYERDQPFEFVMGMNQVIAGWDQALLMLKTGDKAKLVIPPDLGYGDTPMPKIPAGSYLVFEVEVLDVIKDFAPKQFITKGKKIETSSSGLQYCILEKQF